MNRIDAELISRLRDYSDKSACMAHWHTQEGLRDDADYWSRHSQDLLAAADALHSQAQEREGWVLVQKASAEMAATVCDEWADLFVSTPGFDKYERYTYGPAVEMLRDEFLAAIAAAPTGGSET